MQSTLHRSWCLQKFPTLLDHQILDYTRFKLFIMGIDKSIIRLVPMETFGHSTIITVIVIIITITITIPGLSFLTTAIKLLGKRKIIMEFTEAFSATFGVAQLSPDGHHVSTIVRREEEGSLWINVYLTSNGSLKRQFMIPTSQPKIQNPPKLLSKPSQVEHEWSRLEIQWAPNSKRLALLNFTLSKIFVFDLLLGELDRPVCILQENSRLGFERMLWSPDSLYILSVLKHRVGVRLWQIQERFARAYFANPKFTDKGICFSKDGRWMALLHCKDQQDYIVVYNCQSNNWEAVNHMQIPETAQLEDLLFAPFMDFIIEKGGSLFPPPIYTWESPALTNRIFILSSDGQSCKVIGGGGDESNKNKNNNNYDQHQHQGQNRDNGEEMTMGGFERFISSPSGLISVLVKDHTSFALWNNITQRMGKTITLNPGSIDFGRTIIFKERITKEVQGPGVALMVDRSKYESGFQVHLTKSTDSKRGAAPSLQLDFSMDSAYIALLTSDYPNVMWILNVPDLTIIAILQQSSPIRSFSWNGGGKDDDLPALSLVTIESTNIYIWRPTGCLCIPQPAIPDPRIVRWTANGAGDTLLIVGSLSFCLAVPDWTTY